MLPDLDPAAYDVARHDDARWRPAADHLFARHGVRGDTARLGGTALVWSRGDAVLKLYLPAWAGSARAERTALSVADIGLRTPAILAEGTLDGWPYLLMERLPGRSLDDAWKDLDRDGRRRACEDVGRALGRLHGQRPDDPSLDPPGGWDEFLLRRAEVTVAAQRARGLPDEDCRRLEAELPRLLSLARAAPGRALLHTEIGPSHVLVDEEGRPSGVIDFADALVGPPAYDLVAAGLFVARGDPALFSAIAAAAGERHDPDLLWAFTLLFRYSNLPWYLRETGLSSLADLRRIFG